MTSFPSPDHAWTAYSAMLAQTEPLDSDEAAERLEQAEQAILRSEPETMTDIDRMLEVVCLNLDTGQRSDGADILALRAIQRRLRL